MQLFLMTEIGNEVNLFTLKQFITLHKNGLNCLIPHVP